MNKMKGFCPGPDGGLADGGIDPDGGPCPDSYGGFAKLFGGFPCCIFIGRTINVLIFIHIVGFIMITFCYFLSVRPAISKAVMMAVLAPTLPI
jgi:hypothetical protein